MGVPSMCRVVNLTLLLPFAGLTDNILVILDSLKRASTSEGHLSRSRPPRCEFYAFKISNLAHVSSSSTVILVS